jgi:hypothetical protein
MVNFPTRSMLRRKVAAKDEALRALASVARRLKLNVRSLEADVERYTLVFVSAFNLVRNLELDEHHPARRSLDDLKAAVDELIEGDSDGAA